jgi:fucose 4-O-acetylase-like acetyltransferase
MTPQVPTRRDPIDWIVIAKGIGIILVVMGHFEPDDSPAYWSQTRSIIYTFHMPLFFMLSGYLYVRGKHSYLELIKGKVRRLLYPFVAIAAAYLPVKYFAGNAVHVDYGVNAASVWALVSNPVNSYAPLLWFIHALFLIFVFYPLAEWFLSDLAILLLFVAVDEVFGSKFAFVGNALAFLPFFAVGVIIRQSEDSSSGGVGGRCKWRHAAAALAIFAAGCFLEFSGESAFEPGYAFKCMLGVMGSLFVIGVSRMIAASARGRVRNALLQIGLYSMTIYLFHPLFESAVRVGFARLSLWHAPFALTALVAIGVGVAVPMVLERELLRRFWLTRTFVLGLTRG